MNVTEKDERIEAMMPHVKALLGLMNEDPGREGLIKTPLRVAKAMCDLTRGYEQDPIATLCSAKAPATMSPTLSSSKVRGTHAAPSLTARP